LGGEPLGQNEGPAQRQSIQLRTKTGLSQEPHQDFTFLERRTSHYTKNEAARLCSALRAIPANIDGKRWFSIGAALHDLKWIVDGTDIGFEIWDGWSKTSTGEGRGNGEYRGRNDLEKRWRNFERDYDGPRFTIASIFYAAKQYGWIDETPSDASKLHTDLGNAKRLVTLHGKDIRYVHEWKQWIIWGKHHWEIDYDGAAIRLAKETVQAMYIEATKIADHEKSRALIKHGLKSQAEPRLLAMVSLAKSDLEVVLSAKKLDSNPWLLGVPNGVIELKTGDFRTGRREDYITKQAGVPYDAEAKCPEWLKFLDTITGGNGELQLYLQRVIGYCLTGVVSEEVAFVTYGTGNNGKSTFRESLHLVLGDHAIAADAGLLIERKSPGSASEEIARLKGLRLVAINETKENDQFNEARIKYITSNDTITARKLYGHFFDFFPTHKIFVATNHKPIVRGTDEGIWRRLHLIPFTVTIAKEAVEKDFRERRLVPELAGILNWAIEGVLQYRRDGLNPPAVVRAATDDYRHDMDVVGQWIEECCVRDSNASVVTGQAYGNYSTWSSREIGWTLHVQRWRRNLSERGYLPAKGTHGQRMILGLRLKEGFFGGRPQSAVRGTNGKGGGGGASRGKL
jgi:putative DNA primase/helicase